MKFIILNTKGGVGKSTLAVQVLVPFLHSKDSSKKVNLFEFDDENSDSKTFERSEILNAKIHKISSGDLDSNLTDILLEDESLIIDVGGNKTTTYLLNSLKNTDLISVLDCVIIPLMDGEQDSINAIYIYEEIRKLSEDIKIIFALSRVDNSLDTEIQFLDFFGDKKGRVDDRKGLIENIRPEDRNIIKINNSESIKVSRCFGTTAYELAQTNLAELKNKMKEYLKEKDILKSKKVSYRITIINKAIHFKNDVLDKCFEKIDEVLEPLE